MQATHQLPSVVPALPSHHSVCRAQRCLFSQVLRVDVACKDDGKSRGFATATMGNARAARTAIATLNGSELQGRTITISESRADTVAARRGGGRAAASVIDEPGDGYSRSGTIGRNGWVKPDGANCEHAPQLRVRARRTHATYSPPPPALHLHR